MTQYKVKLLTSLKESSGEAKSLFRKVFPLGAIFMGTLEELPKDIVDAMKENSRHIEVQEISTPDLPEVLPENTPDPNLSLTIADSDDSEGEAGQDIDNEEPASEEQPEEDSEVQAGSKLKPKE